MVIFFHMKPVQIMFDEDLLRRLAESEEAKQRGRSEVVRRAVYGYLRRRERDSIERQYQNAYGTIANLESELNSWSEDGEWPDE